MSLHKDTHYWTQLRAALTAGQWASKSPAKTPDGYLLSWPELLRKFNKHCVGFKDVTEIASHTRTLALLLATCSMDDEDNNTKTSVDYPIVLGDECVLPEEHLEEALAGYNALKNLESGNGDTLKFTLAYFAYALGNPDQCLSYLEQVEELNHIQRHIPSQSLVPPTTLSIPASAQPSLSSAGGASYASMLDSSLAEIKDGRSWSMTETLRSICLQGMSHEKISPSNRKRALEAYRTALPLVNAAASEFAFSRPTSPTRTIATRTTEPTPFMRFRELWRWVDRLIWRGAVICARTSNILNDDSGDADYECLWTWLKQYSSCSPCWPADFRTAHRSTISILYLRALSIKHGRSFRTLVMNTPISSRGKKTPSWLITARSLMSNYRDILSASTKFPRAGEYNTKVEEFVDLCAAVWEAAGASGEHASWFIDIMWWATRLTFNSYRVLRHLTRLLYLSGDSSLGKRTLKLYVQVIGKAWQTNNYEVGENTDYDENWVEMLVFGIRMLCKSAISTPGIEGMKDVLDAGSLVEKARTRLNKDDKRLVAYVDMADGIWNTTMAFKEQDPYTRPQRLEKAHSLFLGSVEQYPTALGHFYLALSFAHTGPLQDLQQAIIYAGLAIESDSREVRYWHLLGLLLTAAEQWKAAAEILDRGAALDDTEVPEPVTNGTDGLRPALHEKKPSLSMIGTSIQANGTSTSKFSNGETVKRKSKTESSTSLTEKAGSSTATPPTDSSDDVVHLLDDNVQEFSASSDLPSTILDQYWPLSEELFEHSLQLRLTQVALTEAVEGPEGAEQRWVEVFSWIASKRSIMADSLHPPSTDGRPSVDFSTRAPSSAYIPATLQSVPVVVSGESNPANEPVPPMPIPITVSPATPAAEKPTKFENQQEEKEEKGKERDSLDKKSLSRHKRSMSTDRGDSSKSKKVQQMLKTGVHKGQERITTFSKKIGHGVGRGGNLRKTNSTPDLHAVLQPTSYQASSIHSRRRVSSIIQSQDRTPTESPPPPPPPPPPVPPAGHTKRSARIAKENKMLSDVWLMSAATFRRLGKIEQAKGSIQEAEVRDEGNPAVWVQLGLYHAALGQRQHAIDALQKALFISSEDISATVHLARLYLMSEAATPGDDSGSRGKVRQGDIDLAAGLLSHLTRGTAWDVPEAWYYLAKAYGLQGQKDRERECLAFALELSAHRGVREISAAIGWCI
ncbi:hypothetical protein AX17_005367 [Amanita inopinata Kibby_2008]|nr:hypothetical protein AX17_005367 [Amanita inopinata Kibby_2008]